MNSIPIPAAGPVRVLSLMSPLTKVGDFIRLRRTTPSQLAFIEKSDPRVCHDKLYTFGPPPPPTHTHNPHPPTPKKLAYTILNQCKTIVQGRADDFTLTAFPGLPPAKCFSFCGRIARSTVNGYMTQLSFENILLPDVEQGSRS